MSNHGVPACSKHLCFPGPTHVIEDLAGLAIVAERRGELTLSHEAVTDKRECDHLLSD
jgi:hypothetical protein